MDTIRHLAATFLWGYGSALLVISYVRVMQAREYTWPGVLVTLIGGLGALTLGSALEGWL
jgi:hypothetical protein